MKTPIAAALVSAVLTSTVAIETLGQPLHRRRVVLEGVPSKSPKAGPAKSLKARLGLAAAQSLLGSDDPAEVERGLERLGSVGTPPALEALTKALEPGGRATTARARLVGARALAPHAARPEVRRKLVRMMAGAGAKSGEARVTPLDRIARRTAALALAANGSDEALAALGKALRHEGPTAAAAASALLAHPPRRIDEVLRARGAPTLTLVSTLEHLGDQRAFHALRAFVKRGSPDVQAAAAVALTRLGDLETVELARHWRKRSKEAATKVAAATILSLAHAADAPDAVADLLDDDETRDAGLTLALSAPHPKLSKPLVALLDKASVDRSRVWTALGRSGSTSAIARLEKALTVADERRPAAYALALSSADEAGDALERALSKPATRALAARAAVIRRVSLGRDVDGLTEALETLSRSSSPTDRAVGAWGTAALDPDAGARLLASKDAHVVRAAAAAAPLAGAALMQRAARRFLEEKDELTRVALAVCLAASSAADRVPTSELLLLAERGGAAAPLAARALASRDAEDLRPRIEALLASGDEWVRSHTALGLAQSKDASATGLLARAYRFETSATVRRAIVVALSRRRGVARKSVLRLAARLDESDRVRRAARTALSGRRLPMLERGRGPLWIEVAESGAPKRTIARAATVQTASGVALPIVSGPDGLIVTAGLPAGSVDVRLAVSGRRGKAP